jgi:hypothetical protein
MLRRKCGFPTTAQRTYNNVTVSLRTGCKTWLLETLAAAAVAE